jgi:hypothetical protein
MWIFRTGKLLIFHGNRFPRLRIEYPRARKTQTRHREGLCVKERKMKTYIEKKNKGLTIISKYIVFYK